MSQSKRGMHEFISCGINKRLHGGGMVAFKKLKKGAPEAPLTDDTVRRICNAMRRGAYVETAAVVSGVSKKTFYDWLKKARHPKTRRILNNKYGRLLNAVDRALEECAMRDLRNIDKCARGTTTAIMLKNEKGKQLYDKDGLEHFIEPLKPNWQASAWRLERRFSRRWSKTEKVEHTGKNGGPIKTSTKISDADRRARIKANLEKLKILDESTTT